MPYIAVSSILKVMALPLSVHSLVEFYSVRIFGNLLALGPVLTHLNLSSAPHKEEFKFLDSLEVIPLF